MYRWYKICGDHIKEGLIIHSILEEELSDLKIAAMTTTILSVAERVLIELKFGKLDLCILQGDIGNFVVMEAGSDLILAVYLILTFEWTLASLK